MLYRQTKTLHQYIFYLVVVIVGFSGCSTNLPITDQIASPYASDSPTPEQSLPIILTATQFPNITPPPTLYLPPLLTPRVTPFPTITDADASDDLASMLQTNGGCKFPCFFGIHPD